MNSNISDISFKQKLIKKKQKIKENNEAITALSPSFDSSPKNDTINENNNNLNIFNISSDNIAGFNNRSRILSLDSNYVNKYKTEICKNYELYGECQFGDNCSFAHGSNEIRDKIIDNYQYKTRNCKNFIHNGYCSYGKRCQYLHTEENYISKLENFTLRLLLFFEDNVNKLSLHEILKKLKLNTNRLNCFISIITTN